MAKRLHDYSPATLKAVRTLGSLVSTTRRERAWTQAELAQRVGVSLGTIVSAERGSAGVSIGTFFEMASTLGISLFEHLDTERLELKSNLIPSRVRQARFDIDDDF